MRGGVSVNMGGRDLVERVVGDAEGLKIGATRGSSGEQLIDAGSRFQGGIAAGLRIAEICMGGLGHVALMPAAVTPNWPWTVAPPSSPPGIACLGSQYSGWERSPQGGGWLFFSPCLGPAGARPPA